MRRLLARGWPSAGRYAGPVAWLASTQGNYALVSWGCAHRLPAVTALAALLILISLFGGLLSWRSYRRPPEAATVPGRRAGSLDAPEGGRPHRLVAAMGVLLALLFALAIAVHGAAGLVFSGCER